MFNSPFVLVLLLVLDLLWTNPVENEDDDENDTNGSV
jgi:hypothetical protein